MSKHTTNYLSLWGVGREVSLGREIVLQREIYESRIYCEWTDGERGCCEVWKHSDRYGISVRDAMDLASEDGWIVIAGKVVCPCHQADELDPECDDIKRMIEYFKTQEKQP